MAYSGWSKEDEITILKGLVNLKTEKSKRIDYVALYESIKQSLDRESATKVDLQKKIRCLREKYYKDNLKRARNPSTQHEEELFYLSDRVWGEHHDIYPQSDRVWGEHHDIYPHLSISSSDIRPLDMEATDKILVGDLGLALTTISRNHSNPLQAALQQYKLVSQSLSTRKAYGNQILEALITPEKEEHSELEEQKIARSYFNTKIQHAQLVSDAYHASHGFENSLINVETDGVLKEDTPKAMNEGNCPPTTIGCRKPITGKPSDTSPKSVSEMCHSQEREKKKKRKIKNQEKHCDSSIQSQLEMTNWNAVTNAKDINESATLTQIHTLPDGLAVEVLVKGKADGKVASPGKSGDSMNEGNCPPPTIGCRKPITGKPSDTSPKSVSEMCHSQERKKKKKRKIKNQEKHCDSSIQSQLEMTNWNAVTNAKDINESATLTQIHTLPDGLAVEVLVKGKADGKVASPGKSGDSMNEGNCPPPTIGCRKPITGKPSDTSPKSVSEMCHSQERKKKKKRKIKNQEKHCDSSIQSQLEMTNWNAVTNAKDINESATLTQIHTLPDGLAVEVLVKGKADGKVASPGKQVKVNFIARLRDTGCIVGSNIGAAPHQFCLGYKKMLKGLNIGIEGEKRRLTIPPSLGHGSKAKPPILPDSWLVYEVELVDICE